MVALAAPTTIDQDEEAKRQAAALAKSQAASQPAPTPTPGPVVASNPTPDTNFQLTDAGNASRAASGQQAADTQNQILAGEAQRKQVEAEANARGDLSKTGYGIETPAELAQRLGAAAKAQIDQTKVVENEQASRGGVDAGEANTAAGGIAGMFGGKDTTKHYTAQNPVDTTTDANKAKLDAMSKSIGARPIQTMTGAAIDPTQSDQVRGRQMSLADSLTASANGQGPSAARSTLQAGSDQAISDAMALARSTHGNGGIALKQALAAQGKIGQQTANAASGIAANEQNAARGQLAGVLDASRGQDLGAATTNATLAQDTSKTNLQSSVDQQNAKDAKIMQLQTQGMTLDAAKLAVENQENQFNAGLLAQQSAADKGVAIQSQANAGQQAGQAASAIAGTIVGLATDNPGAGAAAAKMTSDKREKKNVADGEDESRKLLKVLKPKSFDYKDERDGKGRRLGVMAQDVEEAAPELVIDDTDGVKKIDMRKALSASLATLGSIGRRLDKLENRRG